MPSISRCAAQLSGSPIRRLAPLAVAAEKRGRTVYRLNIGQPDIPTPRPFMNGVRNAKIDVLSYSPSLGMPETLSALCGYYADQGIELATEEMCVTTGGSEAFTFAIQAVAAPDEEILVPEPFYPNYFGKALLASVKIVPLTTYAEDGFRLPSADQIEEKISPRTRAIMFSNPGNPTGVVYAREELERITRLAIKHDLFVISDEVYREYVYDGEAISILSFPELSQHAIMVDSISKRISACGARIGMLASHNKELMATFAKMAQIRLSPPTFSQLGLVAFLSEPNYQETISIMIDKFHLRRDTMYQAIQRIPGVICKCPAGAFYIIAKFPVIDDSEQFARWLLTDFASNGDTVMVAPGAGFYATPGMGLDELRLAYVLEEEKIVRAIEVLKEGLTAYQTMRAEVASSV